MSIKNIAKAVTPKTLCKSLKNIIYAHIPPEKRMGKFYRQLEAFIEEAQWWDRKRIEEWQLRKLKEIVQYAYENVPGYRALYRESGVEPDDITSLADLRLLPFTSKELLRDNLKEFTAQNIPSWQRTYVTTSGSTGIPFGFYHTEINQWMENVFMHSGWKRAGWQLGDTSAVLRGTFVGSEEQFWKYDPVNRDLLLSSYYLTKRTYSGYMTKIAEYQPKHLQAYPSAAATLADLILENGDAGRIGFDVILLGSENIYEWQKEKLRAAFPTARLFGWYGHTEQAVLACWCEYSEHYHDWPFYGLTEVLGKDDEPVKLGQAGEIVGTSFLTQGTPFVRYRTMDHVEYGEVGCEACNRQFVMMHRIIGRVQNALISTSGRQIPVPSTSIHDNSFEKVHQFQFYQDTPGKVVFRLVRKDSYDERDTLKIRRVLMSKLGEDMDLSIEFIQEIPRTARGKYQFLDQRLDVK